MILLGYNHGFRASEIIGLTPENVRDGFVTVQRLKGSKRTTQALLDRPEEPLLSERAAIEALVRKTDARKRLFPISRMQFWRIIQKHGKSAGLPEHKCHPHILKHTTGMAMIKKGIEFTRQYLGHQSIASTGAYLKVSDAEASEVAKEAL